MAGGRGVRLANASQVRESEFFVALKGIDLPGQADTSIAMACGFDKAFILENLAAQVVLKEDVYFDERKGQFYARRVRKIEDLELDDPALTPVDASDIGDQMIDALVDRWDWLAEQNAGLRKWLNRWNFLVAREPSFKDELSEDRIRQALEMAAFGKVKIAEIAEQDLVGFIQSTMGKDVLRTLDKKCRPVSPRPAALIIQSSMRNRGRLTWRSACKRSLACYRPRRLCLGNSRSLSGCSARTSGRFRSRRIWKTSGEADMPKFERNCEPDTQNTPGRKIHIQRSPRPRVGLEGANRNYLLCPDPMEATLRVERSITLVMRKLRIALQVAASVKPGSSTFTRQ